jgi:hypothetical protein
MLSRSHAVPVERLRDALRQRTRETSLRAVGREVGHSWKGIEKILEGNDPHPSTLRKLTDWYLRHFVSQEEQPATETARAALAVLVYHLPVGQRQAAAMRLLDTLQAYCEETKSPPPVWIDAVQEE